MDPMPVVYGGAVAALLLLIGWQPWRRGEDRPIGPLMGALAAPVAALVAHHMNAARVAFPPRAYLDWVLLAGLAAVPLVAFRGRRTAWVLALFALGAAALAWFPTASLHTRYWGTDRNLWVGALTAAFVATAALAVAAVDQRRPDGPAALGIAALASAPALGFSGTGQSALLVAAIGGAALVVAGLVWLRPSLSPARGFAAPFAALHAGLVANGVLYAETPRWAGLALLLAPVLVLLPASRPVPRVARLVLVVAAVGAAAWVAKGPPDPYGGY